jgi:hypothetical protein
MASLHRRFRTQFFIGRKRRASECVAVIVHDTDLDVRAANVDADKERGDCLVTWNPFTSHDEFADEKWFGSGGSRV